LRIEPMSNFRCTNGTAPELAFKKVKVIHLI